MHYKTILGIGILLLISGCFTGSVVEEKIEVPLSGAPYSYHELSSITIRFPMKIVRGEELSKISDAVLEKIAPEIKTFTGEKYVEFEPQLSLEKEDEEKAEFVFKGVGYVDGINFDEYEIYVYYDKGTGKGEFDQKSFGWWGVPTKYKIIAEEIARKEKGLDKKNWPLNFLVWNPDQHVHIIMRFRTETIIVNLENMGVVE